MRPANRPDSQPTPAGRHVPRHREMAPCLSCGALDVLRARPEGLYRVYCRRCAKLGRGRGVTATRPLPTITVHRVLASTEADGRRVAVYDVIVAGRVYPGAVMVTVDRLRRVRGVKVGDAGLRLRLSRNAELAGRVDDALADAVSGRLLARLRGLRGRR